MLWSCQLDSQRREGESTVLECRSVGSYYEVIVDDCVLYPEGGGQPADHGTIANVAVRDVRAVAGSLVLHAEGPVPLGRHPVAVDWARRFDHMQQHTAQHLLTALILARTGVATTSFHLGADTVSIDLSRELMPEELDPVLAEANQVIREVRPVTASVVDDLAGVRSRRLAPGVTDLRVVSIQGIDDNTCGGTHVSHTGEIQVIAALGMERARQEQGRLVFIAGGRVLRRLAEAEATLDQLRRTLSTGELVSTAIKLQEQLKVSERERRAATAELARRLIHELPSQGLRHLHRPGADAAELSALANIAVAESAAPLMLTADDGSFVLVGPAPSVAAWKAPLLARVGGRAGGPAGRIQGRASAPPPWADVIEELRATRVD